LDDTNIYNRLLKEYKLYGNLVVAVDYDDTLFDFHKNLSAETNLENIDESNLILIRNFYDFQIINNNNKTYVDLRNNQQVTKLIDGLYMFYGYNESTINKVIQRIKDKIYKRNIIEIESIYLL
jgi:hypothetical protein